jgi:hypothetical protein
VFSVLFELQPYEARWKINSTSPRTSSLLYNKYQDSFAMFDTEVFGGRDGYYHSPIGKTKRLLFDGGSNRIITMHKKMVASRS